MLPKKLRPGMISQSSMPLHGTAGKGKMTDRCCVQRGRPCTISNEDNRIIKGFRNLPGTTLLNVSELKLAPGGTWVVSAFGWKVLLQVRRSVWHLAESGLPQECLHPSHTQGAQYRPQQNLEKPRDPKSPLSAMQEASSQSVEEESPEKPENHIEAKSICKDHEWEHHCLPGQ